MPPFTTTLLAHILSTVHSAAPTYGDVFARAFVDALSRPPDAVRTRSEVLTAPSKIGPWTIHKGPKGFTWDVADMSHPNDEIRFRRKRHQTIRTPQTSLRMLLIGESAAGSWGFFGQHNLASLLESILSGDTAGSCEIVDLTCVNANWRDNSLPLLRAGMTLDPDVVIIYCGNNEARWLLPTLMNGDLNNAPGTFNLRWSFASGQVDEATRLLPPLFLESLGPLVAESIETCRAFGKPVLFVIPPYNFETWTPPERIPAGLSSKQLRSWTDLIEQSESALRSGEVQDAIQAAKAAVDLDGGSCQRSLHVYAQALHFNDPSSAKQSFHKSAFAGFGPFVQAVPSFPWQAAEKLRSLLATFNAPYVDLADIFEHADRAPPLFLDYCHLSERGLRIAANAIGRSLTTMGLAPEPHDSAGSASDTLYSDDVRHEIGLASLCAALHSFQNRQPDHIVTGWLQECLERAPALRSLLGFISRVLCLYQREWITLQHLRSIGIGPSLLPERFAIFILKFIYHARFDVRLCEMISVVLGEDNYWDTVAPQVQTQLNDLNGDLRRLFYLDIRKGFSLTQREMSRRGWERPGTDFVADEFESQVMFACGEARPNTIIFRVSPPVFGAQIDFTVTLNHQSLGEMTCRDAHTSFSLDIPSGALLDRLNVLVFRWNEMMGPCDIPHIDERTDFVEAFGPYPIAALLHDLRVISIDPTRTIVHNRTGWM